MIKLIQKIQKNTFLEKMEAKAHEMYKNAWQRKLQKECYMQGVKDTLTELKQSKELEK